MSIIKGDTVSYTGTVSQLEGIYLEDVPVRSLKNMLVVDADYGTYDHAESIYTSDGYVFPADLLELID
tara:strand:+ start:289 stop:492 length:204 start_codon:yes stop_codon:yes gene_type:complete